MNNIMLDTLKSNLITSAYLTNNNANMEDVNRNHVSYGATTAYAHVLLCFGSNVKISVHEVNGFLKITKIVIDTKEITFEI